MSKLIGYQFRLSWTLGKTHHIADTLSRYPVFPPNDEDDVLVCSIWVARGKVTEEETESDPALERLIEHATNEEDYQKVYLAVKNRKKLNELPKDYPAQHYRSYWHAMSLEQTLPKLVFYHGRVIVPKAAKKEVMETLHLQHSGENKTLANARQLYFWAGMSADIKQMISRCPDCILHLPSQQTEPLIQTNASRPNESVSIDLGYLNGSHYLIMADRFSGWPTVTPLKKLHTKAITNTRQLVY